MTQSRRFRALSPMRVLPALCILPCVWGCATAIHGTTQAVVVNTRPLGARAIADGEMEARTPCSFQLARKTDHHIVIEMPGYEREEFRVTRVPTGKVVNNIWVGGLIGLAVDASTGADNKLVPEEIEVTLRPLRAEPVGDALSAATPR